MDDSVSERPAFGWPASWVMPAPCVGRLVARDAGGRPRVLVPGHGDAPIVARTIVAEWPQAIADGRVVEVLLIFDRGDPGLPIIVGLVHEVMAAPPVRVGDRSAPEQRRVCIEATEELSLKCGQSVLTLRADGRITSRGSEISSRASGANKIKGASVFIN